MILKDEMTNELLNTIKIIWGCMHEQKEGNNCGYDYCNCDTEDVCMSGIKKWLVGDVNEDE